MTTRTNHDVIVIGGGPSGLIACFWLQKLGIRHLLIEKSNFPRDKACGDNLTSKAIRLLNEVDPTFVTEMVEKNILRGIHGLHLITENNHSIPLEYRWLDNEEGVPSCYSVNRSELDEYLMEKVKLNSLTTVLSPVAVSEVEIDEQGCKVFTKDGEVYTSELVFAATGSNYNPISGHDKGSDIHNAVGIRAYYRGLNVPDHQSALLFTKSLLPGGFYITPLEKGVYNINLVMRSDAVKNGKVNLKAELARLIEENETLQTVFHGSERIGSIQGSAMTLCTTKRSICGDRYMLLGDTAGLIDLITGNGIPQGMLSGKLAAQQAFECLQNKNFSKDAILPYQTKLLNDIKSDVAIGRLLNPFLKYSGLMKFGLSMLNVVTRNTTVNSSLIELFYVNNPVLTLMNPLFYFNLIKDSLTSKEKEDNYSPKTRYTS